ncbi:MAG: cation:dicarboxylase symporter family transporter, partial [Alphaproteobacteria bacterium]
MPHKHATFLLLFIVIGVVAGILSGWFWGEAMAEIAWIGKLFLNALKMLIIPLIIAAVVSGVAALGDVRRLGRIGGITVIYFLATTVIAVAIGLVMVNIIQPGNGLEFESTGLSESIAAKEG